MAPSNSGDSERPDDDPGAARKHAAPQKHSPPQRQWHVPDPAAPGPSPPPPQPPPPGIPPQPVPSRPAPPPQAPPHGPPPGRTPSPKGPKAPKPPKGPKGRHRRRRIVLGIVGVIALLLTGYFLWLWSSYRGIKRIDLETVLDQPVGDAVNYLLVGSDSRENLDPEAPDASEPTVKGSRADTIIVLRVGPQGSLMMSVPRDLWVTNPATGDKGRINGTYNDGPANLVRAVQTNLEVPVNHYAEVDFASFAGLIDAVGGITINFEHPAFDPGSGLDVKETGPVTLDGTQALAYVRARNYTEVIDGREVKDPTADLGRQMRQQQFLTTALGEVGSERNPIALGRAAAAVSGGLTLDSGVGFLDATSLARRLGGSTPETVVLPTKGARIGGASVLLLEEAPAGPVLDRFR